MPPPFDLYQTAIDPAEIEETLGHIPRPRLAYIGQIGDRVDFDLLEKMVRSKPDWSLVMIGPVWSNREQRAVST